MQSLLKTFTNLDTITFGLSLFFNSTEESTQLHEYSSFEPLIPSGILALTFMPNHFRLRSKNLAFVINLTDGISLFDRRILCCTSGLETSPLFTTSFNTYVYPARTLVFGIQKIDLFLNAFRRELKSVLTSLLKLLSSATPSMANCHLH